MLALVSGVRVGASFARAQIAYEVLSLHGNSPRHLDSLVPVADLPGQGVCTPTDGGAPVKY